MSSSSSPSPWWHKYPLPTEYEMRKDPASGALYFIDHKNKKTSWDDPRITLYADIEAAKSKKTTAAALTHSYTSSSPRSPGLGVTPPAKIVNSADMDISESLSAYTRINVTRDISHGSSRKEHHVTPKTTKRKTSQSLNSTAHSSNSSSSTNHDSHAKSSTAPKLTSHGSLDNHSETLQAVTEEKEKPANETGDKPEAKSEEKSVPHSSAEADPAQTTKPTRPRSKLAKGPNPDLLSKRCTPGGPNPDYRKGPDAALVHGPDPKNLRKNRQVGTADLALVPPSVAA